MNRTKETDMNIIQEPNLKQIRSDLETIARLIGPGRSYNMLLETESSSVPVLMPLARVMELIPESLRVPTSSLVHSAADIVIMVENFFDQMERGHVNTTLQDFWAEIPSYYLKPLPPNMRNQTVELPYEFVVDALWMH